MNKQWLMIGFGGWLTWLAPLSYANSVNYALFRFQDETLISGHNQNLILAPTSLLKPFSAAYLLDSLNGFDPDQKIQCLGWLSTQKDLEHGCWYKPGHRHVNLRQAMAVSCNHYFYSFTGSIQLQDFYSYLRREWSFYSLEPGPTIESFIGDQLAVGISIEKLGRSYLQLIKKKNNNRYKAIFDGLEDSLVYGTLSLFQQKWQKLRPQKKIQIIYAKTGTSRYKNALVMLFFRLRQKEYLLIANTQGKMASKFAENELIELLNQLEKSHG